MGTSVTDNNLTAVIDCVPYTVGKDHENYNGLRAAIKENDADAFLERLHPNKKVLDFVKKECELVYDNTGLSYDEESGVFTYYGQELHNAVTDRIQHLRKEGMPFKPVLNFLHNLMENGSAASVESLMDFLDHKCLPITPEGFFLAYKSVKTHTGDSMFTDVNGKLVSSGDFVDKYSGRVRNNVGDVISCPRNMVDDNRDHACSHGYHVGALHYSGPDGWYHNENDTILIVKVNPRDAVCVPHDESHGKLRVCEYEVVGVYNKPLEHSLYTASGEELDYSDVDEDEDWDSVDNFVDIDDLYEGDEIKFTYKNKGNGEVKSRHGIIEEFFDDRVHVRLGEEDPSYGVHHVGNFLLSNISNIELV